MWSWGLGYKVNMDAQAQLSLALREARGAMSGSKAARRLGVSGRTLRAWEGTGSSSRLPALDDLALMRVVYLMDVRTYHHLLDLRVRAKLEKP